MELRHLRYLTAVTDATTLVAAARQLGVAQPALTRQVQALEKELDVELFHRGPRGMTLTPAGEVVDASARHVLRQVDAAVERARAAGTGVAGRCVLCVGPRALSSGLVARVIARLAARYPGIEVGVTEGMIDLMYRAVQLHEADVGIGLAVTMEYPELGSETIDFDVFDAALLADGHPLARRASLTLAELAGDTFGNWGAEGTAAVRRNVQIEFTQRGFQPGAERRFDHAFALGAAVASGQVWTLVPRALTAITPPGTRMVPLADCAVPVHHAMTWRLDERRPVIRTVMNVIRAVALEDRRARDGGGTARAEHGPDAPPATAGDSGVPASSVLELRHLRYFCAVVDAGSIGRAAEELALTQPALSRQVGDLERIVGLPLLDRAARGASPTPAGEAFHRGARRILDEVGAIPAETQRARRGVIARCVIAAVPTASARSLVATLMREMSGHMPHLDVSMVDLATPVQPTALRDGRIDLGICHASPMSPVEERGLERVHLTSDVVNCALVPARGPFATRERLTLRDLAEVPFLFPDRDFQPAMYDQLFGVFERQGFRPRVDATYDGLQTIWALIAQGFGWGVGFASQCDAPPPGTVSIPVEGFTMPWGLDLLTRDDESRSLVLDIADRLRDIAHA